MGWVAMFSAGPCDGYSSGLVRYIQLWPTQTSGGHSHGLVVYIGQPLDEAQLPHLRVSRPATGEYRHPGHANVRWTFELASSNNMAGPTLPALQGGGGGAVSLSQTDRFFTFLIFLLGLRPFFTALLLTLSSLFTSTLSSPYLPFSTHPPFSEPSSF